MISCVCVTTAARSWCLPLAVEAFRRQTYQGDELLVVSDGSAVPDCPPGDRCRRVHLVGTRTLGAKRNEAVLMARGDVIVCWDDDDVHHPRRLETIAELMAQGARAVGSVQLVWVDLFSDLRWRYVYRGQRPYLVGGSMAFRKDDWEAAGGYDEAGTGEPGRPEDTRFTWRLCARVGDQRAVIDDVSLYVPLRHGGNSTLPPSQRSSRFSCWFGSLDDEAEAGIVRARRAWMSKESA